MEFQYDPTQIFIKIWIDLSKDYLNINILTPSQPQLKDCTIKSNRCITFFYTRDPMTEHCFISYSTADALEFAAKLANELAGRYPPIPVWFDKIELVSGDDWDSQITEAIRSCKCLLFLMTQDSTAEGSVCKDEWKLALKYKKPIIPLRFDIKAELEYRLNSLHYIDFVSNFDSGLAQLRSKIVDLESPKGILAQLKQCLADSNRDLRYARPVDRVRIKAELEELTEQIKRQEEIVRNPKAEEKTEKNI